MKLARVFTFVVLSAALVFGQEQKKTVSIPEDQLTEQQKQALKIGQVDDVAQKAHGWVGIGKELGQAFDSALGSFTTRSNEFANTKVGKFTLFIVAWKVMGDQAAAFLNAVIHISFGLLELLIFVPVFIWSYRRSCIPMRVCTSREGPFWARKKTWVIRECNHQQDFIIGHCISLAIFTVVWVITVFSY
jgi:hypothetical protein